MLVSIFKIFNCTYNFCWVTTYDTAWLYDTFCYDTSCCDYGIIGNRNPIKNYTIITDKAIITNYNFPTYIRKILAPHNYANTCVMSYK